VYIFEIYLHKKTDLKKKKNTSGRKMSCSSSTASQSYHSFKIWPMGQHFFTKAAGVVSEIKGTLSSTCHYYSNAKLLYFA
jgi:hypothetical protein